MSIITLQNICKSFGTEVVLDNLSVDFFQGEKVGLIGPNGSGKSTILKLITGLILPDIGRVVCRNGLRIAYLPQEPAFSGELTVIEQMHTARDDIKDIQNKQQALAENLKNLQDRELHSGLAEYERLTHRFEQAGGFEYESRIHSTLNGLGIDCRLYDAKTSTLSGGQLSRLALAAALIKQSDILLLDEPTNHLDLEATVWLEKFLVGFAGAAVIISHDRFLLDRVICKTAEIDKGKCTVWRGNYSSYIDSKDNLLLNRQRTYRQRLEQVTGTIDFIARNKDREGMRKTARGRKKRLKRLLAQNPDYLEKPKDDRNISFGFAQPDSKTDNALRCENLTKSFGELTLFKDLTFDLPSGSRLGIMGPNGSGKSTFIKMAMGLIGPTAGKVKIPPSVKVGYLDQHSRVLDPEKTVLEQARSVRQDLSAERLRTILGAFLFSGDSVFKQISSLSGGQQNRLILCMLVLAEPDMLILDEPTNHLDISSREMLEQALSEYAGTIILVSHDRFLLDKIAETLLVIGCDEYGKKHYSRCEFVYSDSGGAGPYSRYAALVEKRLVELNEQKAAARPGKTPSTASGVSPARQAAPPELKRFNRFTAEQLEEMIIELEENITALQNRFADSEIYRQPHLLEKLRIDLKSAQEELDLLWRAYELKA